MLERSGERARDDDPVRGGAAAGDGPGAGRSLLGTKLAGVIGMLIVLWIAAAVLAAGTVGGFFSRTWWLFDVLSHLRVQLALGATAVMVVAAAFGFYAPAGLACIVALVDTIIVLPQLPGRQRPLAARSELRVLFANVFEKNHDIDALVRVIERADADIVVLAEVDADALAQVRLRLPRYPFCHVRAIGPRPLGMGLLAKMPPASAQIVTLDDASAPIVIARFDSFEAPLTVIGAHPLPPYRPSWFARRNAYLAKLSDLIVADDCEAIVVGDFNMTPWSATYDDFLEATGLRDSRMGFGLQTTWPSELPPLLRIAIDHCFVSRGIHVRERCVLGSTGSDHLPIIVDVAFAVNHADEH
jgi:endonuclease/exonuclease/phosphatase (EEP) superfamily protein YafD